MRNRAVEGASHNPAVEGNFAIRPLAPSLLRYAAIAIPSPVHILEAIMSKYFAFMFIAVSLASQPALSGECTSTAQLLTTAIPAASKTALFSLSGTKANVTADDLNEFEFFLKTYKKNTDGTINYIADSITDTEATYKTLYVFNQYKIDNNKKYGVSIRLEIDFKAKTSGFSVANLFGIFGVKGSADKFDGTIAMSVHGMRNQKAAYILPVPTKIDESSAAQFLNYMALVKSMISEANSVDPVELPLCI